MSQAEVEEQMLSYARNNIALEARLLSIECDPESQIWQGTVTTRTGTVRLLAERREGTWSVWRFKGALQQPRPKLF